MYEEFTQDRIAQLRVLKEVSAREMSLSLGQNESYVNQIENGKALPSLQGLFYIANTSALRLSSFSIKEMRSPLNLWTWWMI